MKRTKRAAAVFLLLLTLLLTACQGDGIPAGMDEEALLDRGREVALLLVSGEYETVYGMLRKDVRESTSAEEIRTLVLQQLSNAGVYKQIESSMTTGQSAQGEAFGVAVLYCEFSEEKVLIRVSCDTQMQLIGFSVQV